MSPGRQDKKRLKNQNPRRSPKPTGSPRSSGADKVTIILIGIALILLVIIVIVMNRDVTRSVLPRRETVSTGNESAPVIERVETTQPEEPVVELGVPETVEAPLDSSEDTQVSQQPADNPDATARLFFIRVSDEGKIGTKSVLRPVPSTGSPLTQSIQALLDGPRPGELSNDVLSLIPEGSRLLGARVEGGIAFLNFNEEFRFNALGIEGYRAQVEQIVYTATEFSTVGKVQILIEGQRVDYLGGEGFWVGGPLGREDF